MAITRHAHRFHQIENARLLRSGPVVVTPNPRLSHPHRIRKSRQPLSTASKHPGEKQQWPSRQSSTLEDIHLQGRRESIRNTHHTHEQLTLNIGDEGMSPLISPQDEKYQRGAVADSGSDSAIFNPGSITAVPGILTPSLPMSDHFTIAAPFDHTASSGEEEGQMSAMSARRTPSITLEDVGFPPDGLWDHHAAYEQRFCYKHGESEYLLGTDNRWMFSTDFEIRDAEVTLEAMLQKHKDDPSAFEPHTRRCQAECHGNLLSHVHSVIDSRKHGDHNLYLIEWKACWTPEGNIGDKTWIRASLKVNKNVNCRRSMRVENDFEVRKRRFENMMLVINIE